MKAWMLVVAASWALPAAAAEGDTALALLADNEQDAKDALTSAVEVTFYAKVLGYKDVPKIFPPGELEGVPKAQKDQWIVVLSFCSKKDAAQRVTLYKEKQPTATLQALPVKGKHTDQCLARGGFSKFREEEKEHLRNIFREPTNPKPRMAYASFLQADARYKEGQMVLRKILEMDPDNMEAKGLLQMSQMMQNY